MEKCFLTYLKGKTRLLLTNSYSCLANVDRIFILENGNLIEKPRGDLKLNY